MLFLAGTIGCGVGSGGIGAVSCGFGVESSGRSRSRSISPAASAAIVVSGVPPADLARLRAANMTREQWTEVLRVSVGEDSRPIVGSYDVDGDRVRFTPMFPLDPGRQYHVVFILERRRGSNGTVALPASTAVPSTVVSHVYPVG